MVYRDYVENCRVGELQSKLALWSHQVSKTTIRYHKLFGRHVRTKAFPVIPPQTEAPGLR